VLSTQGIIHKIKDSDDRNAIAVVDRTTRSIKDALFKQMVVKGGAHSRWIDDLQKVVKQFNDTPNQGIEGAAPDDVRDDPTLMFRITEDNNQKIILNERVHNGRVRQVEAAGAFREPVGKTDFQRGFKPRYKSEVEPLKEVVGGMAVSESGKQVPLKRVLAVPRGSEAMPVPSVIMGGDAERDRRARVKLQPYAVILKAYLGADSKWTGEAGAYMKQQAGYVQAMGELRLQTFTSFVKLFPEFIIETGASGGNSKVKVVAQAPAAPAAPAVVRRRVTTKRQDAAYPM
jgi:hypothetical protein